MSDDRDGGDFAAKYPMRDDDPATVRDGYSGPVSRETFESARLAPIRRGRDHGPISTGPLLGRPGAGHSR
jgi:hypothetical protein